MGGRHAVGRGRGAGERAAAGRRRPDARLRAGAGPQHRLPADARRGLRAGGPAGAAADRAGDLPPHPRAVDALPHHPQDRRPEPHHRAGGQGRRLRPAHPRVLDRSAGARTHPDGRHPLGALRRLVSRGGDADDRPLRLVHLPSDRVAREDPQGDERPGHRGQPEGHRFAPELRNCQVFRRRGMGGGPLRPLDDRLRGGGGQDQQLARVPQRRAGAHHQPRPRRGDDHGGAGGAVGRADGRRLRHGQRLHAADHHAAELPGLGLSRDQAVARRHG